MSAVRTASAAGQSPYAVAPTVRYPSVVQFTRPEGLEAVPPPEAGDDDRRAQLKSMANAGRVRLQTSAPTNWTGTPPTILTAFSALGQAGWIPYDAALAVGSSQIVVAVNERWAVYDKASHALLLTVDLPAFFSSVGELGAFDPRCLYDPVAGRFVMIAVDRLGIGCEHGAHVHVAVSQTGDALGPWWVYTTDAMMDGSTPTDNWADNPKLGDDSASLYVSTNQYTFSNFSFAHAKVRVFDKAALYAGAPVTWVDCVRPAHANGTSAFSVAPAHCLTPSSSGHCVETSWGGGTTLTLWRIDGGPSAPAMTRVAEIPVAQYFMPPDAPNVVTNFETNDCRMSDPTWRNGVVACAWSSSWDPGGGHQNVTRSSVRVARVNTATATVLEDTHYTQDDWLSYPAVTVDAAGNVYGTASASSETRYLSLAAFGRRAGETSLSPLTIAQAGAGGYSRWRWGDYSALATDPMDGSVWAYGGWAPGNDQWGTALARLSYGLATGVREDHVGGVNKMVGEVFTIDGRRVEGTPPRGVFLVRVNGHTVRRVVLR